MLRDNTVENNGGILVRGTSANVLVEGNTVQLSDVGVYVNTSTTQVGRLRGGRALQRGGLCLIWRVR